MGGDMTCSFLNNDDLYKYLSNLRKNLTQCSIAAGHENRYFLTPQFKFIKREKVDDNELLKTN